MSVKNNIQAKMTQLDELLAWFDSNDFVLEEAVERFGEAQKLASAIEEELGVIKNNITVVSEDFSRDST